MHSAVTKASLLNRFDCTSAEEEDLKDAGSYEVSRTPESHSKIDERKIAEYVAAVEGYRRQLLWVATRVTNCSEDAEDVLQQALLKAFINLYLFRGDAQMKTWLTAIVRNAALEYVRNQRRRMFLRIDSPPLREDEAHEGFQLVEPSMNPEERYELCEKGQMLRAAIQHMNHVNRRVFHMCVVEKCPHIHASVELNLPVSTVKSRIFRGKRDLKMAISNRINQNK